ncbi:hypothetical protein AVEN_83884-1 [Araneus ventricosus]|uniref:Uncharacterized protein n=1 Tax=Araneus ventricosus TaxID=182803 RepID=A0A4Y2FUP9_ARAVE|nr:hypothetical protein AVEN_83884-1 [Araneus ventricosus]
MQMKFEAWYFKVCAQKSFQAAAGNGFIFMYGNARPHESQSVGNFLEKEGIPGMLRPARSFESHSYRTCLGYSRKSLCTMSTPFQDLSAFKILAVRRVGATRFDKQPHFQHEEERLVKLCGVESIFIGCTIL